MILVTSKVYDTLPDFPGHPVKWKPGESRLVHESVANLYRKHPTAYTVSESDPAGESLQLTDDGLTLAGNSLTPSQAALLRAGMGVSQRIPTPLMTGLAAALADGTSSTAVAVVGDSTSTPDSGWFRTLCASIAALYPAYTVHYRKWNDATQDFDRPIVIQTGAGGTRGIKMATGGTRVGRLSAGEAITGDIDLRVPLKQPGLWASGTTQVLLSKWTSDTEVSVLFRLKDTGHLNFQWSSNGTTTMAGDRQSTVIVPFASGAVGWVRVTMDVDNGAGGHDVKFWTSTDGASWTQLGTTITTAGVASIWGGTSYWSVGARGTAAQSCLADTEIYEVQIRNGIDGHCVVPLLPDTWTNSIGTGMNTVVGAPVLTFLMAAQPGAGIGYDHSTVGYLTDPARLKKLIPNVGQQVMFFSSSHNDYDLVGPLWAEKYGAWVDACAARAPNAELVGLTQNPRTGAFISAGHKTRRAQLLSLAGKKPGFSVIDTYQAFVDDGRSMDTLIADGVHPAAPGYAIWHDAVFGPFQAAAGLI